MASILKVKPGVYRVRSCLGRDGRGRQITRSRTVHGTLRDAQRVRREVEHAIELGQGRPATDLTVGGYLRQWLDGEVSDTKAPRTQMDYQSIVRCHLVPALGEIKLHQLKPPHVLHLRGQLLKSGAKGGGPLSKRRVQYILAVLRKALNDAETLGLVGQNVAARVTLPRPERRPVDAMPLDRVRAILAAIRGTSIEVPVQFIVRTGVRRGEAMALRWRDLDLEAGTVTIRHAMQRLTGRGVVVTPTKRHRSDRAIPLDNVTVRLLRRQREWQAEQRILFESGYHDEDFVFCWNDGRPRDPNTVLKEFQRIARRARLAHVTVYELRQAHASEMARQGAEAKVIQERLGHANVHITLDTYVHLMPGRHREVAERVGAAFGDIYPAAVDARLTRDGRQRADPSA